MISKKSINTKGLLFIKSKKKPNTAIFYRNYKELIYNGTPDQVRAMSSLIS